MSSNAQKTIDEVSRSLVAARRRAKTQPHQVGVPDHSGYIDMTSMTPPPAPVPGQAVAAPDAGRALRDLFGSQLSPALGQFGLVVPLLSAIKGGKYKTPVERAMMAVGAAQFTYEMYKKGRNWQRVRAERRLPRDKKAYTIFVELKTEVAQKILKDVQARSTEKQKNDAHAYQLEYEFEDIDLPDGSEIRRFQAGYALDVEISSQKLVLGEHEYRIAISSNKPGQEHADDVAANAYVGNLEGRFKQYLFVHCRGEEAIEVFRKHVETLFPDYVYSGADDTYNADLYSWNSTKLNWDSRYGTVSRSLESVVLHEGQVEKIINDINHFLSLEQDYVDYGLTWRRGILLSGPPGGGKTSFVKAMASHMRLDIYYLSLQDIKSNDDLIAAIRNVRGKNIIVFEDVDVVVPDRKEATGKGTNVTLDALLNIVDGMLTPHGAIFVMTTNHAEDLDPALLRPGRVDLQIEFGPLDDYQANLMVSRFLGREVELPSVDKVIMPAALSGIFKNYLNDRESAVPEIIAMIAGETSD